MEPAAIRNQQIWRRLYEEGKADLRYPSEVLVRMGFRLLNPTSHHRLLDFGFGTGANLIHFARLGYDVHGVEISTHALATTKQRLRSADLTATLGLHTPGERLGYPDAFFDVLVAWQVLYYNDWKSLSAVVDEFCLVW